MQKEIINDGLSYKEKLECIAKRFGMTQEQALKNIIHDIYISEVTLSEFKDAIVLIWDNNHDECVEFDIDGDADRCLAVDEKGELIDGDKILAIFSKYMKSMGILKNNTCVVTVMTNLGFFKYAKANGIVAATTKVGDRYVLEEMLKGGYNIGGEQSGHIILLDYANTGDGELTGTKLLTVLKCTGEKASELASCMECYPQVLVNVKITADKKGMWDKVPEITDAIKMYSEKLGDEGRILVRESGTEPLVRVMIEGKRTGIITEYAHKIAELIEKM